MRFLTILCWALLVQSTHVFSQNIALYASDTLFIAPETDFWVDYRVSGFTEIAGFSFALTFDTTCLSYLSYQLPTLADMVINTGPEALATAWVSPTGLGITLPDSNILVRLHFKTKPNCLATTTVQCDWLTEPPEFIQFDGVHLMAVPVVSAPQVVVIRWCTTSLELGPPLTLCPGDSLAFWPDCAACTAISWENTSTSPPFWIAAPGIYTATAMGPQACFSFDTLVVTAVDLPSVYLPDSLSYCAGDSLLIAPQAAPGTALLWSTGSTAAALFATAPGSYWVQASNAEGCTVADTVIVAEKALPLLDLGPDRLLCPGERAVLAIDSTVVMPEWSDGSSDYALEAQAPAVIWCETVENGCTAVDTVFLKEKPGPDFPDLGPDSQVCDTADIALVLPEFSQFDQILWSNHENTPAIQIQEPGIYAVTVSLNGCSRSDTVQLQFIACTEPNIYIPNVFAPESLGENAIFSVFMADIQEIQIFSLEIYDRWGSLVFRSADPAHGWDGQIRGRPAAPGVYFYQLQCHRAQGAAIRRSGDLLLVR